MVIVDILPLWLGDGAKFVERVPIYRLRKNKKIRIKKIFQIYQTTGLCLRSKEINNKLNNNSFNYSFYLKKIISSEFI